MKLISLTPASRFLSKTLVRPVLYAATLLSILTYATTADAAVVVTQSDGDLYVIGDNFDNVLQVSPSYSDGEIIGVRVDERDPLIGTWITIGTYNDIDKVWIITGDGNELISAYSGFDCFINSGNGSDLIYVAQWHSENIVDVYTGNGEDQVTAVAEYTSFLGVGGQINVDTGNSKDSVWLVGYYGNFNISLGEGADEISGYALYSTVTLDGGLGMDSCSGLSVHWQFTVSNCED